MRGNNGFPGCCAGLRPCMHCCPRPACLCFLDLTRKMLLRHYFLPCYKCERLGLGCLVWKFLNESDGLAAEKSRSQQGLMPTVSSPFSPLTRLHGLMKKEKENVWCMPVCLCLSEWLFLPRSVYLNRSEQWSTNSQAAVHPCSLCALFKTSNNSTIQARPFLPDLQPRSAPRVRPSAAPALTFALCSLALHDAMPPPHTGDRAPVASTRPWHSDAHTWLRLCWPVALAKL
jgi:hypothetical protein